MRTVLAVVLAAACMAVGQAQPPTPPPCGTGTSTKTLTHGFSTNGTYSCPNPATAVATVVANSCPTTYGGVTYGSTCSTTCAAQPGNANGGMFWDFINSGSSYISITDIGLLSLPGLPSQTSPLVVMFRRYNATACRPGLICTGSIRDNFFKINGSFAPGAGTNVLPTLSSGVPAGGLLDPSWQVLANVSFPYSGAVTSLGVPLSLTLAPGETVGMWYFYADGSKPNRETDSIVSSSGMGASGSTPQAYKGWNYTATDPTYNYTSDGTLTITVGMQATSMKGINTGTANTPNFGNMRPMTISVTYQSGVVACPPPPPPSPLPPSASPPSPPRPAANH